MNPITADCKIVRDQFVAARRAFALRIGISQIQNYNRQGPSLFDG
ncbi:hypothetical protein EBBID32_26430 [Sphingobium indicum BiD32]|uniref:Uncharacterized protein n=1 Tax=Sphingobium indicum BiD32 TaxID=1301087 RepID=N1MRL6_9SPHN|nr:hypothetical protein EBBID32_26430 [Sphingobium indicum BiD32]